MSNFGVHRTHGTVTEPSIVNSHCYFNPGQGEYLCTPKFDIKSEKKYANYLSRELYEKNLYLGNYNEISELVYFIGLQKPIYSKMNIFS